MKAVFDIGGTNIRVAFVKDGKLEDVQTVPTPSQAPEGLSLLASLLSKEGVDEIAGGIAGVLDNGTVYRSPNLPGWEGANIREALRSVTSHVRIENDAALACLGEAKEGAGNGHRIVAYLGIGTGVGGARCVNGELDRGAYTFEPGHQLVEEGRTLESLISGGALKKEYGVRLRELPKEAYDRCEEALAQGVLNTILFWSPEVVVLGGALMHQTEGYDLDSLTKRISTMQHMYPKTPDIRRGTLGDVAGLVGATLL